MLWCARSTCLTSAPRLRSDTVAASSLAVTPAARARLLLPDHNISALPISSASPPPTGPSLLHLDTQLPARPHRTAILASFPALPQQLFSSHPALTSSKMPPKAQKTPTTGGKAPAGKAPAEKKEAGKKTAAPSGDKKKRTKSRKETYSSYIYKGEFASLNRSASYRASFFGTVLQPLSSFDPSQPMRFCPISY